MALKRNERYPGRFENPTAAQPQGAFKNRTSPTSQDGSYLEADWANDISGFLSSLLVAANITPNGNVDAVGASQYFDAMLSVTTLNSGPIIGMPMMWPSNTLPVIAGMTFFKMNGTAFNTTLYPKLAAVYPSGILPDYRGEFLRGWDDGRGVDAGRTLGSLQLDSLKSHLHRLYLSQGVAGNQNILGLTSGQLGGFTSNIYQPDGSTLPAIENTGGSETRPRNISINFITRAV